MSVDGPTARSKAIGHNHNGVEVRHDDDWPNDDCSSDDDEWFWTTTLVLKDLRQFARSRWVPPYSMLGCVLARVATTIPPEVVLPPLRVGFASLNFFVALVGSSGATKSGSGVFPLIEPNQF
jgi:hypothetical protein